MTRTQRLLLSASILMFIVCGIGIARAATNLAVICPDATQAGLMVSKSCSAATQGTQIYKTPAPNDLIRVDPTAVEGGNADWSDTNTDYVWMKWSSVPVGMLYETCKNDLPDPTPFTSLPACTGWAFVKKAGAPPVAGTGQAILTWTASTQNTDGSALTNLGGYKVWQGASPTSLLVIANVNALTYTVNGLPVGTHYFAVSAYNTAGVDSVTSNPGSKQILAVVKIPKSPGALTIQ